MEQTAAQISEPSMQEAYLANYNYVKPGQILIDLEIPPLAKQTADKGFTVPYTLFIILILLSIAFTWIVHHKKNGKRRGGVNLKSPPNSREAQQSTEE